MLRKIVLAAALGSIAVATSAYAGGVGGGAHVKVFSGSTGQATSVYRPSTGVVGVAPRESHVILPRAKLHVRKSGGYDGPY
jgi:hypothetical protein